MAISYSNTVTIQLLTLRHCKGISLKIENLKEMLSLRNSTFIHNQANLSIFIPSSTNEALHENKTIMIYSSIFLSGKYCVGNHCGKNHHPKVTNPGITMVLNQTHGHATVRINNVSMHIYPQDKFSTGYSGIHYNMYTASVYLERLHYHTEFNEAVPHMLYG